MVALVGGAQLNALTLPFLGQVRTAAGSTARSRSQSAEAVLERIAKGDVSGAFQAAEEGKSKGDPACTYLLGQMYEQGKGVKKPDAAKALSLYEEAAKAKVPEAMSAVARCFENGLGAPANPEKGFFYWQMAAEAGDPPALGRMALAEIKGHGRPVNLEAGRSWAEKAAKVQDPLGLYLLSRLLEGGIAGVTANLRKAVELCSQAATLGNTDAMHQMGHYYAQGQGFAKDLTAAAGWYRLAADFGNVSATATLAACYLEGRGTRQSDRIATDLAMAAARSGEPRAEYLLGRIFEEGLGCTPSPVFALAYHFRASKGGIKEAGVAISRLKAKLDSAAVKQAETLAAQAGFHVAPPNQETGP
jgi:TPR repeat protein